jgi:hypothetical protein
VTEIEVEVEDKSGACARIRNQYVDKTLTIKRQADEGRKAKEEDEENGEQKRGDQTDNSQSPSRYTQSWPPRPNR